MHCLNYKTVSLILLMVLFISYLYAQSSSYSKKKKRFINFTSYVSSRNELGGQVSIFAYTGELNTNHIINRTISPGGSIFYRRNISSAVYFRFNLSAGFIKEDAANENNRMLRSIIDRSNTYIPISFRKGLFDFKYLIEYHFLDFRKRTIATKRYTPYLAGGMGGGIIGDDFVFYLPIGVGIKVRVGKKINLEFELLANKTFTDQLDEVSFNRTTAKGYLSSNTNFDTFLQLSIGTSYRIITLNCPEDTPIKKKKKKST